MGNWFIDLLRFLLFSIMLGAIGGLLGRLVVVLFKRITGSRKGLLIHLARVIARIVYRNITPPLSLLKYRTILCNHCFRYTSPFRSRYEMGRRYCEYCQQEVEQTKDVGKVILHFGTINHAEREQMASGPRVFLLVNPDFEQRTHPIEVSTVWIDTQTCEQRLFERFMTYILHYPPKQGVTSVQVLYKGNLHEIGENLKNAVQNTFTHVRQFHEGISEEF